MASSGTINNTFRPGYAIRILWSISSQSVSGNTSTVTARVQLVSLGSTYNIISSVTKYGTLTIDGNTYNFTFSANLEGGQTRTLYTKTVTIAHNSAGAKTCSFSTTCGINVTLTGVYWGNVSASGSGVFDGIARSSTISSITSNVVANGSNAVGIGIDRQSHLFTHTVAIKFGSYSTTITGVTTATSFVIPVTWNDAIPSATSGTATATLTTYSGSEKIGTATSRTFTITVPDSVIPSVTSVSVLEASSGIREQFNAYVQNKSRLAISILAEGEHSSEITQYRTDINGVSYFGQSITSEILDSSGYVTAVITVTDSRGRTGSTTRTVQVLPYFFPTISRLYAYRCDGSGTQIYEGCCVCVSIKFDIAAVGNANSKNYELQYKLKSSSTWGTLASGSVYAMDEVQVFHDILTVDNSYDFRLTISDFFTSAEKSADIPTAFTLLDARANGRGLAVGKVSEKNGFEVSMPIYDVTGIIIRNGIALYEESGSTDPDTTQDHLILTQYNTPGTGGFYYVMTLFYQTRTSNRSQIAIPYNQATRIYFRTCFNGVWSAWQ